MCVVQMQKRSNSLNKPFTKPQKLLKVFSNYMTP